MQKTIDITDLLTLTGINHRGTIQITHPDMTGLEPNPKDDWLYLGLLAIKDIAQRKGDQVKSAAFIGSGNGIETIAALKLLSHMETLFVTDLVQEIQPGIIQNITANAGEELKGVRTYCLGGRDCHPLPEPVDLIYGNLPLIMFDNSEIEKMPLSRTTLTDTAAYLPLSLGPNDILLRWSLLSQLGFLITAKEKLAPSGSIITLIGGRVPAYAIDECFRRAGLVYRKLSCTFKRQSDAQFLKQYAEYEQTAGVSFAFYDYAKASDILRDTLGVTVPELLPVKDDIQLKELLAPALLSAQEAYQASQSGKVIGHIAYAFEAWNK